jgi:dipeptidyl aminopeptidase/acylaminoacyl peptidase
MPRGLDRRGRGVRRRASVIEVCLWLAGLSLALARVAPAGAELPQLIPRRVLFGDAAKDGPQISPDGSRLAYLAPAKDGVMSVWVRTLGKEDDHVASGETKEGIGLFSWAWDDRHLLTLQDRNGDENLHLWSIDLQTGDVRDLTPFPGARATNLLTSSARPHQVLVGLNRRDPRVFDMYRVDLETGEAMLDTENPGDVLGWTTDADFQIRAACALDSNVNTVIRVRDAADKPWRDLLVSPFAETPILGQINGSSLVVDFTADGRGLYVASAIGSNTTRLVQLDTATGRELKTLAQDPKCDLRAAWGADRIPRFQVLVDPAQHTVQAAAFEYGETEWKVLDPVARKDFDNLKKTHAGELFVASRDRADRTWVVGFFDDVGPTSYYLYERASGRATHLFDDHPDLAAYRLAPMQTRVVRARDGLELLCYLTLPQGVPARKLPLVLLVHGGPWARDGWGYDPMVQWLANRGYAVLQVNFRGSMGFGTRFLNAGNGQWGVGAMQNDLTDAVHWAVEQGIADPKRVAIAGGSYGGYATLAGIAFTPDLYVCAIDIVGPSNVATLLGSIPLYWAPVKKRWVRRVGDAEHDAELNRRISPLFHVDRIRAPLLIGHGANDPRVKQEESDRIVHAMREHHLEVTYIVYPDEGHGFGRTENNLDFFGRAEEFLGGHLGGRVERFEQLAGTSAQVR